MTRTSLLLIPFLALGCAGADPDSDRPDPGGSGDGDLEPGVDAGAPGDDPTAQLEPGGYIKLSRFVRGGEQDVTGLAELFAGHTGPGRLPADLYRDFPADRCFAVPLMPSEPSFYNYVDLGESIELSDADGGGGVSLVREQLINTTFYKARELGSIAGRELDVEFDGARGRLRVPAEPVVTEPDMASGVVTFAGPLTFRWQPTGADRVLIILQQGDLGRVCRAVDDGELTISGDDARGVPAYGTAVFMTLDIERITYGGREIELVGLEALTAEYERR